MADLEDHFDDANPWNVVQRPISKKKTILPVKIEGIVNGGAIAYGRRTARIHSGFQTYLYLTSKIWNLICLKDIEVQVIDVDQAE